MFKKDMLKYSIWETPFFFIKVFLVFIKLTKAGALIPLLNSDIISNRLKSIIKIINFFLYKNDKIIISVKLLNCLTKLGPGFIKFGQALSTRPDLIGVELSEHLSKLQDDIKIFSGLIAKDIFEQETKLLIKDIFISFDQIPIASASVAQVHIGILKNGEKVAVKILKPKIKQLLFNDFIFFYWVSKCIEFLKPNLKRLKLSQTVEFFSNISLNEIERKILKII